MSQDPATVRLALILPFNASGHFDELVQSWTPKPFVIPDIQSDLGSEDRRRISLFPEVAEAVLGPVIPTDDALSRATRVRFSIETPQAAAFEIPAPRKGHSAEPVALYFDGFEAIRMPSQVDHSVEGDALLVIHMHLPKICHSSVYRTIRSPKVYGRFIAHVSKLLLVGREKNRFNLNFSAPTDTNAGRSPFLVSWVPTHTQSDPLKAEGAPRGVTALEQLAWHWAALPSSKGLAVGFASENAGLKNTHTLSDFWMLSLSDLGAAYIVHQNSSHITRARAEAFTTHLDYYIYFLLSRIRARSLGQRLNGFVRQFQMLPEDLNSPTKDNKGSDELLESSLRDATALANESALFLASAWRGAVVESVQPNRVYKWTKRALGLEVSAETLAAQADLLNQRVAFLHARRQQQLNEAHEATSRRLESVATFFTVLAVPIAVVFEVWSNWSDTTIVERFTSEHWLCWLLWPIVPILCLSLLSWLALEGFKRWRSS